MRIRYYITNLAGTVVGSGTVEGTNASVAQLKANLGVGQSLYTLAATEDFPTAGVARPPTLGTLQ